MKAKLHFPTEEYGFTEVELEVEDVQDALDLYSASSSLYKAHGLGLTPKEWNSALDEYLETGSLKDGVELYQQMSLTQQACFQEIKKSLKRLQAKDGELRVRK